MQRRLFICGLCGAAIPKVRARAQSTPADAHFLCSTIDPEPSAFNIVDHSASFSMSPLEITNKLKQFSINDHGTAYLKERWRPSDGLTPDTNIVTLGVHFMEADSDKIAIVKEVAYQWLSGELGNYVQLRFDVPVAQSQIRVRFAPSLGNNSYVGRQNLLIAKTSHTMNLQNIIPRIVLHEFGHALGLQHEQHHPDGGIQWNEKVVIEDLRASQGWSDDYIRASVINRFRKEFSCVGDPKFNDKSIMLYEIPPRWTTNGFSSPVNEVISQRDRDCLVGLYSIR